ncbi:MAG: NAD-dependent epimerase/dehydratase family protein [Alkalinema sp. RU_4_3]|nr:NAD-dependent epimerase/dehydratase family protein [Alkalinema sp. RU_4_3]
MPEPKKDRPTLASDYVAPSTPLESQLASVWSQTLGIDYVGVRDNFFELGGHSLIAASLLQSIERVVELEIPLFYLLKEPTIEGLVKAINIMQKKSDPMTLDMRPQINWETEIQLDPTILPQGEFTFIQEPKAILITGVSGFLGAFLLQELLQTTTAEIYCLVRADNIAEGSYKIQSNLERYQILNGPLPSRVIPLLGDLAQPKLGLTQETFQGLALKLDAIYHSGAFINLVYPYSAMRATNVLGTQELLRLACQGKVTPMHFISTIDMFQSPRYFAMEQILENTTLCNPDELAIGYPQTKWVAEHLVMAARDRGLPVAIYRPGMLTGHSSDRGSSDGRSTLSDHQRSDSDGSGSRDECLAQYDTCGLC